MFLCTLPTAEILRGKNAHAWVSMVLYEKNIINIKTKKSFLFFALIGVSSKPSGGHIVQGPLNIWTEHSNCQIHSRGGLKNPYSFTDTQYFLDLFYQIIFLCI